MFHGVLNTHRTCSTRVSEIRLGVDMSGLTGVFGGRIDF
jgi:hypothetical protein